MPLTATAFFVGLLSVTGVPPLACFWSKFMILSGAMRLSGPIGPLIVIFILCETLVSFGWMLYIAQKIFLGAPLAPVAEIPADPPLAHGLHFDHPDDRVCGRPAGGDVLSAVDGEIAWSNAVRNIEASIVILILGSLVSLLLARNRKVCGWVSFAFVCASSVFTGLAVVGACTVASGEHTLLSLPQLGARLTLRVDPLSAIFLAIVAVIALLSTLYSVRYMEHYAHDKVAKFFPLLLLCVASMTGVLVCTDFFFFLIFWESMTLTSYFLVTFESENPASQRAGLKYFIITHGATLCMVAAALLLWRTSGSFSFDAIRQTLSALLTTRPFLANTIIFLFFLGFATKAGILPMGDWLPDAHPVAPSGMSATLSGALVKLGIYGLVRLFCSFLVASPSLRIWGIILALAGTGSLFVGTLTALRQTDTKRLMAFHTIGQIGYICLGLGVGVYCLQMYPALASIALAGAILHAVNHACFKSCLFLGAGSVLYRTGQRDMDKLGGLAAFMPYTTGTTTIASLSIAGVPPFNGFYEQVADRRRVPIGRNAISIVPRAGSGSPLHFARHARFLPEGARISLSRQGG